MHKKELRNTMCYNEYTTSGCGCNNGCNLLTWLFGNGCRCRNNGCACACSQNTATTQNGCGCWNTCNVCTQTGTQNTQNGCGCCSSQGNTRNNYVCVTYCGYANGQTTGLLGGDAYYARQYGLTTRGRSGCGCTSCYNN